MNVTDTTHSRSLATAPQLLEFQTRTGPAQAGAVVHRTRPAPVIINPVITPASSIIVVKKPHTTPARVAITLSTSSPSNLSGTLSRVTVPTSGGIHIFRTRTTATEMQFDGRDNVFTGLQLRRGVQVFATADRPSGAANDFQLTLTLTAGPTTGAAVTVPLTAVELTLDVGLSRPSPGVAPPLMSANDKINIGRFVQVRNPGFDHERAMLILRPPTPLVALTVRLEALNAQVRAFGIETPDSGQVAQPSPATFPTGVLTIPPSFELFVEATAVSASVRDTGFRYGVDGVENEADRVAMTAVQFDVTNTATNAAAATSFVRFGLWDNAFDPATGNLRNGATDATHFIGADTRRFFFRLRDPNAAAPQLEWRTVKADGTADHAPAGQPLQLQPSTPGSRLFFSRPVFMVTDEIDRQLQNSGLAVADVNLLLPRIRKVTIDDTHQLDTNMAATYSPAAGQTLRNAAVLFSRTPEERRRMRVHLVNVRSSVGAAGVLSDARKTRATDLFRSLYAVCGIYADVIQAEIVIDPPASSLAWPTVYPGNAAFLAGPVVEGFSFVGVNLVPSASQSDIITVVRGLAGFDANDIYLVFVNRILAAPLPPPPPPPPVGVPPPAVAFRQNGGESFPDSFTAAASTARGFTFVSALIGSNNVEVHEATHVTTDLRNAAGGHYDLGLPATAPVPPVAPGNVDGKNIMHRFGPVFATSVLDPKRLWNTQITNNNYAPPLVIPPQIDAIRISRFVHNF